MTGPTYADLTTSGPVIGARVEDATCRGRFGTVISATSSDGFTRGCDVTWDDGDATWDELALLLPVDEENRRRMGGAD